MAPSSGHAERGQPPHDVIEPVFQTKSAATASAGEPSTVTLFVVTSMESFAPVTGGVSRRSDGALTPSSVR